MKETFNYMDREIDTSSTETEHFEEQAPEKGFFSGVREKVGGFFGRMLKGKNVRGGPEGEADERLDTKKAAQMVGGGLMKLGGSLFGVKFFHDLPVWLRDKYNLHAHKTDLQQSLHEVSEKHRDDEEKGEFDPAHVLREMTLVIATSERLTAEQKSLLMGEVERIVHEYDLEHQEAYMRAQEDFASVIDKTLESKISGTTVIKEGVNTALMVSGLSMFRSMAYGSISLYERHKRIQADRGGDEQENEGYMKRMFVDGVSETMRDLTGHGESWQERLGNRMKAVGTIGRVFGFTNIAVGEMLDEGGVSGSIDVLLDAWQQKGAGEFVQDNFVENVHRVFFGSMQDEGGEMLVGAGLSTSAMDVGMDRIEDGVVHENDMSLPTPAETTADGDEHEVVVVGDAYEYPHDSESNIPPISETIADGDEHEVVVADAFARPQGVETDAPPVVEPVINDDGLVYDKDVSAVADVDRRGYEVEQKINSREMDVMGIGDVTAVEEGPPASAQVVNRESEYEQRIERHDSDNTEFHASKKDVITVEQNQQPEYPVPEPYALNAGQGPLHAIRALHADPEVRELIIESMRRDHEEWSHLSDDKILVKWRLAQLKDMGGSLVNGGEVHSMTVHEGAKFGLEWDDNGNAHVIPVIDNKIDMHEARFKEYPVELEEVQETAELPVDQHVSEVARELENDIGLALKREHAGPMTPEQIELYDSLAQKTGQEIGENLSSYRIDALSDSDKAIVKDVLSEEMPDDFREVENSVALQLKRMHEGAMSDDQALYYDMVARQKALEVYEAVRPSMIARELENDVALALKRDHAGSSYEVKTELYDSLASQVAKNVSENYDSYHIDELSESDKALVIDVLSEEMPDDFREVENSVALQLKRMHEGAMSEDQALYYDMVARQKALEIYEALQKTSDASEGVELSGGGGAIMQGARLESGDDDVVVNDATEVPAVEIVDNKPLDTVELKRGGSLKFKYDHEGNVVSALTNTSTNLNDSLELEEKVLSQHRGYVRANDGLGGRFAVDRYEGDVRNAYTAAIGIVELEQQGLGKSPEAQFLRDQLKSDVQHAKDAYGKDVINAKELLKIARKNLTKSP